MPVPQMPIHEEIEAKGDDKAINSMSQLVEWLSSEGYVLAKDPDNFGRFQTIQRISYPNNLRIIFDFLGYDYDGWIAEKDALVKHLNELHRENNQ